MCLIQIFKFCFKNICLHSEHYWLSQAFFGKAAKKFNQQLHLNDLWNCLFMGQKTPDNICLFELVCRTYLKIFNHNIICFRRLRKLFHGNDCLWLSVILSFVQNVIAILLLSERPVRFSAFYNAKTLQVSILNNF